MDDIFREIRDNSIREAYFDALKSLRKSMPYISTEEIIQEVMKKEAPRFFITYDNARRVISLMHRGKPIRVSNENKLCMYKDLYARFLKYKSRNEGARLLRIKIYHRTASAFLLRGNRYNERHHL